MRMAVVPAVLVTLTGCATKEWVTNLVGKKEAEVNSRVDEQGQKVTAVGERAERAHTRADAAYSRADEVNDRLSRLWKARHNRTLVETIHVQFGFDKWDLTDGAQTALLGIVKELHENPALSVDLEGFTDATGPHTYNIGLSQRRVEAVRRYLIEQGAELPRVHSVGLGPLAATTSADEQAKQRRVTLRLMLAAE
jgi:outer membrane protein OmpA-like peptidoglycan-associated protein